MVRGAERSHPGTRHVGRQSRRTDLPGPAFLVAVIPDEDPDQEPAIHVRDEHVIPYEIMHWFMENTAEEVNRRRLTLEQNHPETRD